MKKFLLSILLTGTVAVAALAQSTITKSGDITANETWTSNNQYLLSGYVYVTNNAVLTIQAGTVIKGDLSSKGALIIEEGSKIIAKGDSTNPIVFTSNQAPGSRNYGDWGGVIVCGKAPVNWLAYDPDGAGPGAPLASGRGQVEGGPRSLYGGTNAADSSGILSYVRIEFAGIAFSPNNEINGLTLCGVGSKTQIDHIQVSYSGDDAIECFGGTVNMKNIFTYQTWDDDFDTDNGYSGMVQFGVVQRGAVGDQSGSKGFESDSYQSGTVDGKTDKTMITKPVYSNMTVIGPLTNPAGAGSLDPNFVAGVHIRRGSALSLMNSIVAGWPAGILIDEASSSFGSTLSNIYDSTLQIQHTVLAGMPTGKDLFYVFNGARSLTPTTTEGDTTTPVTMVPNPGTTTAPFSSYAGPFAWFRDPAFKNKSYQYEQSGVQLKNPFDQNGNPSFIPNSTSPLVFPAGNAAVKPAFTSSKVTDPFFKHVSYVGAFNYTGNASDNWMATWTEMDPTNADYTLNTTSINDPSDLTASIQVYPNPSNGRASIVISLENSSEVEAGVYSVEGAKVADIVNGNVASGRNSFDFDGSSLTKGIYIVKVITGKTVKTTKLVIQ
ncbi:MAG: T9SS type A sorting domain-containing protein [Cytophagaceae bacterium]